LRQEDWADAVERHLLPSLGPRWWLAGRNYVVRGPAEWTACMVGPEPSQYGGFRVSVAVKLLADPEPAVLLGERLGRNRLWDPSHGDDWAAAMTEIGALIRTQAVPLFDRFGTLPGYLSYLNQSRQGQRSSVSEHAYYCQLLLDDSDADVAAEQAERDARPHYAEGHDGDPEALARVQRVRRAARRGHHEAVAILAEQASTARRILRLI
jgi:hypothetical protein